MKILFLLVFLGFAFSTCAQKKIYDFDGQWLYGIKAGATLSSIDGINTTIIREWYPANTYAVEKVRRWGFTGGVFFYHRFPQSAVAVQPEVTYAMQGSHLHYADTIKLTPSDTVGLDYLMKFRYQYINITPLIKIFPFHFQDNFLSWWHVDIGLQLGVNVTAENITYTSNKPYLGPDLQIQQNLRGVLKGKTDVSVALGFGLESKGEVPISFDARVNLGFVDTIETLANGYNFIENPNRSISFQATLGYAFLLNK